LAVDCHLEQSAGRLDQTDLGFGEVLLQLSRQTGSSGLVASNHAVLNGHIHCNWPWPRDTYRRGRIVVAP
jgi:hypothetical protein